MDTGQDNIYSTVQEVLALEVKLLATEDEDEQRVLEEDITGKILWFCWCGICTEVDQLLLKMVNQTWDKLDSMRTPNDRIRFYLREIANTIKGARYMDLDHDTVHLRRIMLDAGAGVSKHGLWLAARAVEQVRQSRVWGGKGIDETASSLGTEVPLATIIDQQTLDPGSGGL